MIWENKLSKHAQVCGSLLTYIGLHEEPTDVEEELFEDVVYFWCLFEDENVKFTIEVNKCD